MAVKVRGKNIEVTQALKDYVEKRVQTITKQFKTVGEITAVMRVEKGNHTVEITVPASGIVLRAQETSDNMYASIDQCVEKIERQIHKYKTRLMKRKYSNFKDAAPAPLPEDSEEVPEETGEFTVARTKNYAMRPMGVQEAIMQMNMLNHDFFVFFNAETEKIAIVYRRKSRGLWPDQSGTGLRIFPKTVLTGNSRNFTKSRGICPDSF